MDYYEILGVPRNASATEIERGFRSVARRVHPDLNLHDGDADARMKQLNHIRDTLVDPLLRAAYDDRLRQEGAIPPQAGAGRDGESAERRGPSRFGASRATTRPPAGAPHASPGNTAAVAGQRARNTSPPAPTRRRWLAALALVLLPAGGVLAVRFARQRPADGSPATTPSPAGPAPLSSALSPVPRAPAIASLPPKAPAVAPPARAASKRGRVVRIGSTSEQVRSAFGPPDRMEPGARPDEATMIYGNLRLDLRQGRVVAGAAPASPGRTAVPARGR